MLNSEEEQEMLTRCLLIEHHISLCGAAGNHVLEMVLLHIYHEDDRLRLPWQL